MFAVMLMGLMAGLGLFAAVLHNAMDAEQAAAQAQVIAQALTVQAQAAYETCHSQPLTCAGSGGQFTVFTVNLPPSVQSSGLFSTPGLFVSFSDGKQIISFLNVVGRDTLKARQADISAALIKNSAGAKGVGFWQEDKTDSKKSKVVDGSGDPAPFLIDPNNFAAPKTELIDGNPIIAQYQ